MAPVRRALVAAAFLGLTLAAGAADRPPAGDPAVVQGKRLVEGGDLERAVNVLEAALARLGAGHEAARATAHLYLAMAHLGLEKGSLVRLHLREAWVLRSGKPLEPRWYPPRVIELYEENRRAVVAPKTPEETPAPKAPEDAPDGTSVLPFAIGAAAGAGVFGLSQSAGDAGGAHPGPPSVRLFNCDDGCRVWLNGHLVSEVGLGQDSGRVDVAPRMQGGRPNVVAFEVTNVHGAISYGLEVWRGEAIVFQQVCGVVSRLGCEDDTAFPPGIVRRYEYVLPPR